VSLSRGDLPPAILTPPPGPRARESARRLAWAEAPGVNTVAAGRPPEAGPILWEEALGANVQDVDGNLYIDLTAGFGVAAVGHRHPRVVAAIRAQSEKLLHALGDVQAHPGRVELATRLAALSPVPDAQVFFATSGAEAVEVAVKTAILTTGRSGVLAFDPAYHGLTLGALAATSRPEFRQPFARHLHPHLTRLPFGAPIAEVERELARGLLACVLVEPIVGREGVLLPPPGWLAALAALCRERDTPLVADEIFTGFGRTGALFAVEAEGAVPDLLCCGKALGGGLPIAAVLGRRDLFRVWEVPGEALHTSTFLGNPLACAAALAVLDILLEEKLPERATALEPELGRRLGAWPERFRSVVEVRGRGLLWGIELATREDAKRLVAGALARGVLLLAGGPEGRVAQIVPPLAIAEPQLFQAVEILEAVLAEIG
jgi:4-aminobutyrate aminotransferase / (S)-3-amino-2-methylpropionate transaminase / 5-aminovalerate transaminase